MKRAIVIILVLLLLAGGGAGGLIMLGIVPNPFSPKIPEKPLTAAEKAAQELAARNKFKPPLAAFVQIKIDDMVIPVIMNGQSDRRVMIISRIIANQASDKAYIQANVSRFQDAVIHDLVPYFQNYFLNNDMVDVPEIKVRLVKHAKTVFGDRAKDVLLVNAFEQSSNRIQ